MLRKRFHEIRRNSDNDSSPKSDPRERSTKLLNDLERLCGKLVDKAEDKSNAVCNQFVEDINRLLKKIELYLNSALNTEGKITTRTREKISNDTYKVCQNKNSLEFADCYSWYTEFKDTDLFSRYKNKNSDFLINQGLYLLEVLSDKELVSTIKTIINKLKIFDGVYQVDVTNMINITCGDVLYVWNNHINDMKNHADFNIDESWYISSSAEGFKDCYLDDLDEEDFDEVSFEPCIWIENEELCIAFGFITQGL